MRKITITTAFIMLFTLCSFAQNDTWNRFASKDAVWSALRPFAFRLNIVSVAGNECELKGEVTDSGIGLRLKGKAWVEDNKIKFKLTSKSLMDFSGQAIHSANTTMDGTIKAFELDETHEFYDILKHEYKYPEAFVDVLGNIIMSKEGSEITKEFGITLCNSEIYDVLERKAEKEKEAAEKAAAEEEKRQAEIKYKATPEYKTKSVFENLLSSGQIGLATKKKFNFGKALSSVASADVAGLAETVDSNTIIDVHKYADESKNGIFENLSLQIKTKDKAVITSRFEDKCVFETENPKTETVAYYTSYFSQILFVTRVSSNSTAFLWSDGKLYKLDKKTQKQIIQ